VLKYEEFRILIYKHVNVTDRITTDVVFGFADSRMMVKI